MACAGVTALHSRVGRSRGATRADTKSRARDPIREGRKPRSNPMPDDPQLDSLKLPPHSLEAEQSVLGGLLLENEAVDKVADVLADADFYSEAHRLIYAHILKLAAEAKPADVVTVSESLASVQKLEYVGGLVYLGALVQNVPTAANIRHYAHIVRDRSILRQLAATAGDIADSAYNPLGRSAKEVLDQAEAKVLHIAEQGERGVQQYEEIGKILPAVVERIETLYNRDNPSDVTGVPTGFADLDQKTSGFQPGDLIVIAGRPSMGKTALALNIGEHVALNAKLPVAVFSMEMGASQLAQRMIGSVGRLDQHKLRTGRIASEDWDKLSAALGRLSEAPIMIDETPALNAIEVRSRARRIMRILRQARPRHRRLSAADAGDDVGREPRDRDLGDLARDEVAREGAQGAGRRAVAAQSLARAAPEQAAGDVGLRESGAIEQDADVILFIYRDEVYNPDSQDKGVAEIIIGKQRNGPIGKVDLAFLGEYTRFENLASSEPTLTRSRARRRRQVALSSRWRRMITPGRNSPCPCGSGKRYKDCHGALAAPADPLAALSDPTRATSRWVSGWGLRSPRSRRAATPRRSRCTRR